MSILGDLLSMTQPYLNWEDKLLAKEWEKGCDGSNPEYHRAFEEDNNLLRDDGERGS